MNNSVKVLKIPTNIRVGANTITSSSLKVKEMKDTLQIKIKLYSMIK